MGGWVGGRAGGRADGRAGRQAGRQASKQVSKYSLFNEDDPIGRTNLPWGPQNLVHTNS